MVNHKFYDIIIIEKVINVNAFSKIHCEDIGSES